MADEQPHRRLEDLTGFARVTCWLALRATEIWDFIDRRQLDCWGVSIFTLLVTWKLTEFDIAFVKLWLASTRPGYEVAAIIGAINTPWALLQAAVVKFVFDARQGSFERGDKK